MGRAIVSIDAMERMLLYYLDMADNARQLLANSTDEEKRAEHRRGVESWERIVAETEAAIESARKRTFP